MNKMILLEGIPPNLNLGVSFVQYQGENDNSEKAYLSTFYEDTTHTMGIIDITLDNIMKLKHFNYVYLEEIDGKWEHMKDKLIFLINREFVENELIGGFRSEDEIEF